MQQAPPVEKRGRTSEDEPQPPASKRTMVRKRAALACEECRARKRRCDGATPACGGCTKRMVICVYSSEVEVREWHHSMIQSLRTRLEELEKAEKTGMSPRATTERHVSTADNRTTTRRTVAKSQTMSSASVLGLEDNGDADLSKLAGSAHFAGSAPSMATSPFTAAAHLKDHEGGAAANAAVATTTTTTTTTSSGTFCQSPAAQNAFPSQCIQPCSFERLMKPIDLAIDKIADPAVAATTLALDSAPSPAVAAVPHIATTCCTCDHSLNAMTWCLPLRRFADDLVTVFFHRHHRMFPILHKPTFMKQYEQLWESKESVKVGLKTGCSGLCKQKSRGRLFPATVYAVFTLGSLFASQSPEQNAARADPFFRLVQGIDLFEILDDEVGIELVQLGLLMGHYLQSTERFSKCWNISGLTIRMAQNIGLHFGIAEARKRGLFASCPTQLECEMRTRVWYGCVILETELSMSFGQPSMIPASGKGIKLPEAIDDDRLSDEVGKLNAQPKHLPSVTEYFVQTIKLYDILKQVLDRDELNTGTPSEATSNMRAILSLDTQIMEWRDCLPTYLKHDPLLKECSPPGGVALGEVEILQVVLDLPALSKRLYCRFLHTRQLILRPALELLFEKQQHNNQSTTERSMEARLQDAMLSDIASQCVLSANSLVDFLAVQIQSQNFTCWWYNISYLHTCGSTILMGRSCTFGDSPVLSESMSASWELCLQYLSRYTEMSSIAKKSSHLLQESAKRLLLKNYQQTVSAETEPWTDDFVDEMQDFQSTNEECQPFGTQESVVQSSCVSQKTLHPTTDLLENQLERDGFFQPSRVNPGRDLFPEIGLDEDYLEILGGELWDPEPMGISSWPFMPFLSQLETFPPNFDISNISQ